LAFIQFLAEKIGATVNLDAIDTTKKHASYSEKQLKAMRWLANKVDMRKRRLFKNNVAHFIWKLWMGGVRYSVLYIAKWLPATWFSVEPLIAEAELQLVREAYEDDWLACSAVACSIDN
jgi:hypothetical protein